jgi:acyl transferase domain-containing protein
MIFDYPNISLLTKKLNKMLNGDANVNKKTVTPTSNQSEYAIIGMSCKLPSSDSLEELWKTLIGNKNAISLVPQSRWDIKEYEELICTNKGGFISDMEQFDPIFFNISPKEALSMDPQQRLVLELSWTALEDANLIPSTLLGTQTGVYIGVAPSEYGLLSQAQKDGEMKSLFEATGTSVNVTSGRVSYVLGLEGPCLSVDTACSSSLVSIHLACQGLKNDECDVAIAGGVNTVITPYGHIAMTVAQALSPEGQCKTFDESADGYVRSEGCGIVILKRLADAHCDGDVVHAIICGSSVSQDGASGGLTVPNGNSQEKLLLL